MYPIASVEKSITDDPLLEIVPAAQHIARLEPNRNLTRRGVGRIAAVNEVATDRLRVVAADRARRRFDRIGRPDHPATTFDPAGAFDDQRYRWGASDIRNQPVVKRLSFVFGVVSLGPRLVADEQFHRGDHVTAPLETDR